MILFGDTTVGTGDRDRTGADIPPQPPRVESRQRAEKGGAGLKRVAYVTINDGV